MNTRENVIAIIAQLELKLAAMEAKMSEFPTTKLVLGVLWYDPVTETYDPLEVNELNVEEAMDTAQKRLDIYRAQLEPTNTSDNTTQQDIPSNG